MTEQRVLTPDSIKQERWHNKPFLIVSKQFGEISSHLSPYLEQNITIHNGYQMTLPTEVIAICQQIKNLGGRALIIGGCVRDTVITQQTNRPTPPKDIDIEVYGLEPKVLRHILEITTEVNPEGQAFQVLKASIPSLREPLDVSIPRTDSKTGPGHTDFSATANPGMTILEAGSRRDLTMNTLAYDPLTKEILDPFNGIEDLKQNTIKVTSPNQFIEDPLRVLRIMQFIARFKLNLDPSSLKLCQDMVAKGDLDHLPIERITTEFEKLLQKGQKPSLGLEFARQSGIIDRFFPELHNLIGTPQDDKYHPEGDVWTHTLQTADAAAQIASREKLTKEERLVLILSAILHDCGKPVTTETNQDGNITSHHHEQAGLEIAQNFLNRLKLPRKTEQQILALVPQHMRLAIYHQTEKQGQNMNKAMFRLITKLETAGTDLKMLSLLTEADQRARNPNSNSPLTKENTNLDWQNWAYAKQQQIKDLQHQTKNIVDGKKIMDVLGLKKGGPIIGKILDFIQDLIAEGTISTQQQALELIPVLAQTISD